MKNRVIVAHPQQQHSYKVAGAFKKFNILDSYITTVYYEENQPVYKILKKILSKSNNLNRLVNRRSKILDLQDVKKYYEKLGLLLTVLIRIDKRRLYYFKVQNFVDKIFGNKVAQYASTKENIIIVMFDKKAYYCFDNSLIKNSKIVKILDMSSAADNFTQQLLNKQMKQHSQFQENYEIYEHLFDPKSLKMAVKEYNSSDYFVVASTFTKRSLIYNGIEEDRIFVIPYGINVKDYKPKHNYSLEAGKVKYLFTGGIHPRKGIIELFESFKKFNTDNFQLTLAGQIVGEENIVNYYKDLFHYAGHLQKDEMNNLYTQNDILVQPTLHDGFSFSILEGMASGLPVICTENSVGADIIVNGYNGFVVKAGDVEDLSDKIEYFMNNPNEIKIMGTNARLTAEQYTWKKYEESYIKVIDQINKKL